jgi:hypothetical protein
LGCLANPKAEQELHQESDIDLSDEDGAGDTIPGIVAGASKEQPRYRLFDLPRGWNTQSAEAGTPAAAKVIEAKRGNVKESETTLSRYNFSVSQVDFALIRSGRGYGYFEGSTSRPFVLDRLLACPEGTGCR